MNYVMSDIHGRLDLLEQMLEQIDLKDGDMLYILGDCIDRGGGLSVAVKLLELYKKGLVTFLTGNHEVMLYNNLTKHRSNARVLNDYTEIEKILLRNKKVKEKQEKIKENPSLGGLLYTAYNVYKGFSNIERLGSLQEEIRNSLTSTKNCTSCEEFETWKELNKLSDETITEIMDMFASSPTPYKVIDVGEKQYILVHGGIYYPSNTIGNLFVREEFYANPTNKEVLKEHGAREDCVVIFGHTTTRDINIELNGTYIAPNKIWFDTVHNDKIGIDCGASFPNGQLACLRLEDMKEYYVRNESKFIVPPDKVTEILQEPTRIYNELFPKLVEVFE